MSEPTPRVLAIPDYRESNPYQARLAAALDRRGVTVEHRDGRGVVLPVTRAVLAAGRPPVVHLHFLAPYMIVGGDRYESLGLAGPLSVLLGLRLVIDLTLATLLVDRVVWTAHDLRNHETRAVRTEQLVKHVTVRWLCDAVIVHCDRAKPILRRTFRLPASVTERMRTIPHGHFIAEYPDEVSRREARRALDVSPETTLVVFFGLIRRYKNVPHLIETVRGLDRADVRLVVAGNPRSDDVRRRVTRAAADCDRVQTVLEFVPDEAVQRYMRAADVVALPFRTVDQTMLTSGSAILAMGFARPIVTPRIGCLPAVLGGDSAHPPRADPRSPSEPERADGGQQSTRPDGSDHAGDGSVTRLPGGVVYDEDDQLGEALRVAFDADLDRMGRRNRRVAERLDWAEIAARTAACYRA